MVEHLFTTTLTDGSGIFLQFVGFPKKKLKRKIDESIVSIIFQAD